MAVHRFDCDSAAGTTDSKRMLPLLLLRLLLPLLLQLLLC